MILGLLSAEIGYACCAWKKKKQLSSEYAAVKPF